MQSNSNETFFYEGYSFKKISILQAYELLKDLTDFQGNPLYTRLKEKQNDSNAFFLLAEGEAELEKLTLEFPESGEGAYNLGFIFLKSLLIKTYVISPDTDRSPALVVLGNLTGGNIALGGNTFYIGGILNCETIIGDYNHGRLYVKGLTYAALVYSNDMPMHFENFALQAAIYNCNDSCISLNATLKTEDGNTVRDELYFPNNVLLSDLVWDAFIETGDDGAEELVANFADVAVIKNITFIDPEKNTNLRTLNSEKEMIKIFSKAKIFLKEQQKDEFEFYDEEKAYGYLLSKFEHEGKPYLRIYCRDWTNGTRMGGTMNANNPEGSYMYLEYLNDNNEVKYIWSGTFTSTMYELKCAMHHIRKSFAYILKEAEKEEQSIEETDEEVNETKEEEKETEEEEAETETVSEKLNRLLLSATTSVANPYHTLWRQWINEIVKVAPKATPYFNLRQGIDTEQANGYQHQMKIPLPAALQDFYTVFDVEYHRVSSVFCFAINGWAYDLIPFIHIPDEWEQTQELCGNEEKDFSTYPAKIKISDYANPNWIPFAEARNGDMLLFDTDPGNEGVYGQIIELLNESRERNVVAGSLKELMENQIDYIKNSEEK